ncbi:hypothetical protein Q8A73_015626 [Channa argus]|nr:hypothetical protein Q8A73_015626 [Channa argus]
MGSMNSINPQSTEAVVAEGRNINLTCKYEGSIYNIQWYRQYQRSRPEFLLYITETGSINPPDSDFSAHIEKTEKQKETIEHVSAQSDLNVEQRWSLKKNMDTFKKRTVFSLCNTLEDDITAIRTEVVSSEGHSVTLSCKYSVKAQNLQWYRQDPGSAVQYLLLITDTKEPES